MRYEATIEIVVETTPIAGKYFWAEYSANGVSSLEIFDDHSAVDAILKNEDAYGPLVHIYPGILNKEEISLNELFYDGLTYEEALPKFRSGEIKSSDFVVTGRNHLTDLEGNILPVKLIR